MIDLYLFSVIADHNAQTDENEVVFLFTEQAKRSRITLPGQDGDVVITESVPLVFMPFMPIDHVIHFLRQAANHLEDQLKELDPKKKSSDNGD
jgi:hypothetical protein